MDKPNLDDNNIQVEDGENYRSSEPVGIKEIALKQFWRCVEEGSKEMRGAGKQNKIINGSVITIEIPNQREIFTNSVDMLEIILLPNIMKSKLNEDIELANKEIEQCQTNYDERVAKANELIHIENSKPIFQEEKKLNPKKLEDYQKLYDIEAVVAYKKKLKILSYLLCELEYFNQDSGAKL